jgi:hypothetical protein
MKITSILRNTLCAALLIPVAASAQSVGIGTVTPDSSAALDITATNKGLLIPRISLANRPVAPAVGLMIYQTDNTPGFYTYDGTTWNRVLTTANTVPGTIASLTPINGAIGIIAAGGANSPLVFAGPTVTVNITATSQKLVGSIGAPLGIFTTGPAPAEIGLCYQSAAGAVTNFVGGNYSFVPIGPDRKLYTVSATVSGLAPGTYTIGLGIRNTSATAISNNDYANGYIMLVN